jgi:hypothetical protein
MRYSTGRRIILVSSIFVTTCFLLAGKYDLPGGASHFTAWANLIAFGGSTTSDIAQRDVGYPLLLVMADILSHNRSLVSPLSTQAFQLHCLCLPTGS